MLRSIAILIPCLALSPCDCPAAPFPGPGTYHVAFQERQAFYWRNGLQASGSGDGYGYMLKLRSDTLRYGDSGARLCLQGSFGGGDYGGIALDSCGFAPDSAMLYYRAVDTAVRAVVPFSRSFVAFPRMNAPAYLSYVLSGDSLILSCYWIHLQNEVITFLAGDLIRDTVEFLCRRWIEKNPRLRVLDANQSLSGEIDRFVWKLLPGLPSVPISVRPTRRPFAGKPAVDARGRRMPIPSPRERPLPAYRRP